MEQIRRSGAPHLHLDACLATPNLRHVEWFHDHVRIEPMLFDGAVDASGGVARPDLSTPDTGWRSGCRRRNGTGWPDRRASPARRYRVATVLSSAFAGWLESSRACWTTISTSLVITLA